jgi:hypothetical protein
LERTTIPGLLCLAVAFALLAAGAWLARRYRRAANYSGIGRGYPLSHGLLGALGGMLVVLGLCALMVACIPLFFTPG